MKPCVYKARPQYYAIEECHLCCYERKNGGTPSSYYLYNGISLIVSNFLFLFLAHKTENQYYRLSGTALC